MPTDPHPHDEADAHETHGIHDEADANDAHAASERSSSEPETASGQAFACSYCDRAFAEQEWRDLHHGIEHPDGLDAEERAAYEAARAAETEELRLFRLKALAALVLLYFLFVMAYAVFA